MSETNRTLAANEKQHTISTEPARGLDIFEMTGAAMRLEAEPHSHHRAQLLVPLRGAVLCAIQHGLWLVPQNCAIWIPSDEMHSLTVFGAATGLNVLLDAGLSADLPSKSCTVAVSARLDTLLSRLVAARRHGATQISLDVQAVLLNELAKAPVENLHLPMPVDTRLRHVVTAIMADPATRRSRAALAEEAGIGERTLDRAMLRETGLGFARWRQQFAITAALRMMAEGSSVQTAAHNLGYDSAGGFIKMFRRVMGKPPTGYVRMLGKTGNAV